jgi:hypothetical protein
MNDANQNSSRKRTHGILPKVFACLFAAFHVLLAFSVFAAVGPGITIETMNGTIGTWDRLDWVEGTLTDTNDVNPTNGLPDSIRWLSDPDGAQLNIFETYHRGAIHLELDNIPTDDTVRLDASTYQGQFNSDMEHWGMAVVIYFNPSNFVSLGRIRAGGGGWMSFRRVNGAEQKDHGAVGHMDFQWRMQGIELTATHVNFYATPIGGPDTFNTNDFDSVMTLDLSHMSFSRPASFIGDATLIVGKGWSHDNGDPWDSISDLVAPKTVAIDATRVTIGSIAESGPEITDFGVAYGTATVSFVSIDGTTNRLESTPDLVNSNFSDTGASVLGDGTGKVLTDPAGSPNSKSYRVTADP